MKTFKELKKISDDFFKRCNRLVKTKPYFVIIAMHEYSRNLYAGDPYIPFPDTNHTERLYSVTSSLISLLDRADRLGHYPINFKGSLKGNTKDMTGKLYQSLWSPIKSKVLLKEAADILRNRMEMNNFDISYLKGKTAIDVGCGSGRYTYALKKLGCKSVLGVDWNISYVKPAMRGVFFKKCDILKLPFKDKSFDFVFCNGVLQHTEDLERGFSELVRICRGKIWLYIYGDGGMFWHALKKMRKVMKKIPLEYTKQMLNLLGVPLQRTQCDNWYVPIETHTLDRKARRMFKKYNLKAKRLEKSFPYEVYHPDPVVQKIMWGDGELRYILEKDKEG